MEYRAEEYWAGWWGGWGDNTGLSRRLNERASEGWRLTSTKSGHALYYWLLPRTKLLFIWERERPAHDGAVTPAP